MSEGDLCGASKAEPVASVESLEGAALDKAVADAMGRPARIQEAMSEDYRRRFMACLVAPLSGWDKRLTDWEFFSPSTDWKIGGPIIERERLTIGPAFGRTDAWVAMPPSNSKYDRFGPTPLIAAMRAYVASKASGNPPEALETDSKRG